MKMNVRIRNTTVTRMLSVTLLLAHITALASMGTQETVWAVWVRTARWNVYYHMNIKLHNRASRVLGHSGFSLHVETREMLFIYTVTKAAFVNVLRCLLHNSWVITTRSTRENFASLKFDNWSVFAMKRVHFTLTTSVFNTSSVFF